MRITRLALALAAAVTLSFAATPASAAVNGLPSVPGVPGGLPSIPGGPVCDIQGLPPIPVKPPIDCVQDRWEK
ncbi:hypothetical protein PWG71_17005 [Nocardiopsis sp. N85]|uniref:hypothetical protein n=1 Tax=Nocardiopsis sp. N85 TaxID=3029400 RepID=UPI00237EF0E2|nr:hypothetical protein [Nocardiopsis sp. N85]MDE3723092.1 hypothetical protein [Nocardiopsis sp. N85]